MSIQCTAIIQKEEDWYVATDVQSRVGSQGKTLEESLANLREALALYYDGSAPAETPPETFVTTMEVAV